MSLTIHINTGRTNWPRYTSIDLETTTSYAQLKEHYPTLFEDSRKLFVLEQKKWRHVQDHENLTPSLSYRTESYITKEERMAASLICIQCGTRCETIEELRYHSGELSAHEWGYNITYSWEWSCCNRIVSTKQIQSFHAGQGCNIGKCQNCRDKTPYQKVITQHEREIKEAWE